MTEEIISRYFSYDPKTGEVKDLSGTFQFTTIRPNGKKYLRTTIGNKQFLAHRIGWFLHHLKWPENQIDHINGCGTDNRLCNLREVTGSENQKNRRLSSNNKTGISGVFIVKNRYVAQIKNNSEKIYLGSFTTFFDACCARKSAERRFGFHENHGSVRPL